MTLLRCAAGLTAMVAAYLIAGAHAAGPPAFDLPSPHALGDPSHLATLGLGAIPAASRPARAGRSFR